MKNGKSPGAVDRFVGDPNLTDVYIVINPNKATMIDAIKSFRGVERSPPPSSPVNTPCSRLSISASILDFFCSVIFI